MRLLVGATLLALTFAGGFAVAAHKTVTLTVDGAPMTVTTMKSRVIDVVKENGFDVGERDDLYPAADDPVQQSDTIVLRRSRPLQISLDGRRQQAGVDHGVDRRTRRLPSCDDRQGARGGVARQPRPAGGYVAARRQREDRAARTTPARSAPLHLAAPNVAGLLEAAGVPLEQSDRWCPRRRRPSSTACRSR